MNIINKIRYFFRTLLLISGSPDLNLSNQNVYLKTNKVASNDAFLKLLEIIEPECLKEKLAEYIKEEGLTHQDRELLEKIMSKALDYQEAKKKIILNKVKKYKMIST